jgi:hypothetical protein
MTFLSQMNPSLYILYSCVNFFTGNFNFLTDSNTNSSLFNSLGYFNIYSNQLTGSLPWKDQFKELIIYEIQENYFSSSLQNINNIENQPFSLQYFVANNNYLIASIPIDFLSFNNRLFMLDLSENLLTGTIPYSVSEKQMLNQLLLASNFFTGNLPWNLGNITYLAVLDVSDNSLSGTIPSSFLSLSYVEELFLQNNRFQGQLNSFLDNNHTVDAEGNVGHFLRFINVDISNNEFSGALVNNFFLSARRLQSFTASSNCLDGSLPEEICSSKTLLSLSLDGLTTAENCRQSLFFSSFSSYFNAFTVNHFMEGTIPSCFYSIPSLQLLHLSGNGFTGSIPSSSSSLNLSTSLIDLSLSHNLLSGTIPLPMQQKAWLNLDLSYNKLKGTLSSSFHEILSTGSLSLEVNRISGSIPSSLLDASTISVLNGNIISCNGWGKSTGLPSNDPEYHNYVCGSSSVNDILISWIIIVFLFPLILFVLYWKYMFRRNSLNNSSVERRNQESKEEKEETTRRENTGGFAVDSSEQPGFHRLYFLFKELMKELQSYRNALKQTSSSSSRLTTVPQTTGTISEQQKEGQSIFSPSSSSLSFSFVESRPTNINFDTHNNKLRHINRLSLYFEELRKTVFLLTLYCICILLPVYSCLKIDYSSYQVEYAWTVSGLLFSGEIVAICLFFLLGFFVILTVYLFHRMNMKVHHRGGRSGDGDGGDDISSFSSSSLMALEEEENGGNTLSMYRGTSLYNKSSLISRKSKMLPIEMEQLFNHSSMEMICIYLIIIIVDLIVMCIVDFSYVYIVLTYNFLIIVIAAFGLALFRLFSNRILLTFSISFLRKQIKLLRLRRLTLSSENQTIAEQLLNEPYSLQPKDISMLENLILFNNIIIPGIAIMFILPDCFYNALFAASSVTSSYSYTTCYQYLAILGTGRLCNTLIEEVSYSPPFIYSFQCSSKIIINYVSVYIFMFILVSLIVPFVKILLKIWHSRLVTSLAAHEASLSSASTVTASSATLRHRLCYYLEHFMLSPYFKPLKSSPPTIVMVSRRSKKSRNKIKKIPNLFSKLLFTIQINSYLTIFITFGVLFPPLAIIACFSIFSITYFEEFSIGYLLVKSREAGFFWYEEQIDKECERIEKSSHYTIWSTLIVSCCLFGYILFDTMGDSNGWEAALPMTVLMIFLPISLLIITMLLSRKKQSLPKKDESINETVVPETTNPLTVTREVENTRQSTDSIRQSEIQLSDVRRTSIAVIPTTIDVENEP